MLKTHPSEQNRSRGQKVTKCTQGINNIISQAHLMATYRTPRSNTLSFQVRGTLIVTGTTVSPEQSISKANEVEILCIMQ